MSNADFTIGSSPSVICDPQSTIRSSLLVVSVALLSIGVIAVASANASLDRSLLSSPIWATAWGRQLLFALFGVTLMVVAPRVLSPLRASPRARRLAVWAFFLLSVGGLVATMIPALANPHHGSARWLRVSAAGFSVGVQPSEFTKVALVLFVAFLLADRNGEPRSLRRGFLPPTLAMGGCAILVGIADFGTAVLLVAVGGLMLLVAGCRLRHLMLLAVVGLCGFAGLLMAAPYRLERIRAFQQMWQDPQGAGYQPLQSLATIASGGWLGVGLGAGVQKYGYLPESHTDFIFSIICEETGVVGGGLVIGLFCLLIWLGLRTMRMARSPFERLVAFGLTATLGLQAAMNIAVVTVVVPTKGISLPLISAGGSGTLSFCLAISILAAITTETKIEGRMANGNS